MGNRDWILVVQERDRLLHVVNPVMKISVP